MRDRNPGTVPFVSIRLLSTDGVHVKGLSQYS